jgi:hypothetical protein
MPKVNYSFNCFSLILIFIGFSKVAAAQDNRFYNAISKKVQIAYNTEDPMNMYALTAPAYQEKMSASIFINGTKNFYIKAGKWENLQFKEQTDGGMTYIAEFERETQLFF